MEAIKREWFESSQRHAGREDAIARDLAQAAAPAIRDQEQKRCGKRIEEFLKARENDRAETRRQAIKEFEDRLVNGDFPERLTAAIRKQRDEELREKLLSDEAMNAAWEAAGKAGKAERGQQWQPWVTAYRPSLEAALDSIFEEVDDA